MDCLLSSYTTPQSPGLTPNALRRGKSQPLTRGWTSAAAPNSLDRGSGRSPHTAKLLAALLCKRSEHSSGPRSPGFHVLGRPLSGHTPSLHRGLWARSMGHSLSPDGNLSLPRLRCRRIPARIPLLPWRRHANLPVNVAEIVRTIETQNGVSVPSSSMLPGGLGRLVSESLQLTLLCRNCFCRFHILQFTLHYKDRQVVIGKCL